MKQWRPLVTWTALSLIGPMAAAAQGPAKVLTLAGQSNMQGHAAP